MSLHDYCPSPRRLAALLALAVFPLGASAVSLDLTNFDDSLGFVITGFKPNSVPCQVVSGIGDFNNDGLQDFVLGSPMSRQTFIVFGQPTNSGPLHLDSINPSPNRMLKISGGPSEGALGIEVSGAGDVNGDGHDDVLVATGSGFVYLLFGGPGPASDIVLDDSGIPGRAMKIFHSGSYGFGSYVSAAGDFNGDGFDDFVISAYVDHSQSGTYGPQCDYLILGRAEWPTDLDMADFVSGDSTGMRVFCPHGYLQTGARLLGDFNGDSFSDVLVHGGRVVLGRSAGLADITGEMTGPDYKIVEVPLTYSANPGVGDFNRDGLSDMVGKYYWHGFSTRVFLVKGRAGSPATVTDVDDVFQLETDSHSQAGFAGDLNADGFSDVLHVDNLYDQQDYKAVTTGTIVHGHADGIPSSAIPDTTITFGKMAYYVISAHLGDVDGDGTDDLGVGYCDQNSPLGDAGVFYVLSGAKLYSAGVRDWQLF